MNDSIKREKKEFAHSSERENYRPNGKTNEVKTKRVHNLIIVDESGSMEVIRKQAFVGMNETLQTVRKMQEKFPDQEQFITLLTFDTGHTTWHYDNLPAAQTKDLDWKLKKQNWTFTLIGTDNLDVETMAHSFAIDEHLEFQQDDAGTKAMFARERRSRERYNCCVAEDAAMPTGSFFSEDES